MKKKLNVSVHLTRYRMPIDRYCNKHEQNCSCARTHTHVLYLCLYVGERCCCYCCCCSSDCTRGFPRDASSLHTIPIICVDPWLQRSETIHVDRLDSLFCTVPVALSERHKSFRCKEHVTRPQQVTSVYDQEHERLTSSPPVQSFTVSIRVPASTGVAQDG